MSVIFGGSRPLGYSGSTPPSEHCPDCGNCNKPIGHCEPCAIDTGLLDHPCQCLCWRCDNSDMTPCTEPEEHELCGWHLEEAKQAEADYWNDWKQDR